TQEPALTVGPRRTVRGSEANLDLVQERCVPHRDARLGARRAHDLEERARAHTVEPAAHLAVLAEARFDPTARTESLPNARDDRARIALLPDVPGGARAELTHALQEVLFPREEDHRCVAQRHVAPQRTA